MLRADGHAPAGFVHDVGLPAVTVTRNRCDTNLELPLLDEIQVSWKAPVAVHHHRDLAVQKELCIDAGFLRLNPRARVGGDLVGSLKIDQKLEGGLRSLGV